MTHYFTNNETLKSCLKTFDFHISNEKFSFKTDVGVFSRNGIDYGSYCLLNNVLNVDLKLPILDLGCGYGAIGIIVSKIKNCEVCAVDINDRAVRLCNENAILNQVKVNAVNLSDIRLLETTFKTIILNPPIRSGKNNVFDLYQKCYECLGDGGSLYIVIQKKQGAKSSYLKLLELFKTVRIIDKSKGYQVIQAIKSQH